MIKIGGCFIYFEIKGKTDLLNYESWYRPLWYIKVNNYAKIGGCI